MYIYFDRPAIKERAKQHLSGHYWLALGVALLTSAGGVLIGSRFNLNLNTNNSNISNWRQLPGFNLYHGNYRTLAFGIVIAFIAIALVALAFQLALYYFVKGPLEVGGKKYYLGLTHGESKFKSIVHAFVSDGYKNVCKTMFLRQLYIFLWLLLAMIPMMVFAGLTVFFVVQGASGLGALCCCVMLLLIIPAMIPAIIKSLEYSMIPYLLAEHPEMSTEQAFAASKYLTDGHKGHLFVLELSFIGWILLGMLCCGIGVIFVTPYILASEAEAYHCLCSLKHPPNPTAESTTEQPPMTDSTENTEDMGNSSAL